MPAARVPSAALPHTARRGTIDFLTCMCGNAAGGARAVGIMEWVVQLLDQVRCGLRVVQLLDQGHQLFEPVPAGRQRFIDGWLLLFTSNEKKC